MPRSSGWTNRQRPTTSPHPLRQRRSKVDRTHQLFSLWPALCRPFRLGRHGRLVDCDPTMSTSVSPLAPVHVPDMPAIPGVRLATAAAGIRYAERTDVLLALFEPGTTAAGVFTRSKCPSAPVEWCRAYLKKSKTRALVVNSGNANAFTGKDGRDACKITAQIAARAVGCKPSDVFLASTGVIGEPLKAEAFDGVMEGMVARAQPGDFLAAA